MKNETVIRSRSPVRIDFSGGWTDVALFTEESKGFVVNAAIDVHSYVTVKKLPKREILSDHCGRVHREIVENKGVKIYSVDYDIYQEAEEVKQLEYNGNIDLTKAAIRQMEIQGGLEIITRSNAPAGSGLGTSASMGVALIGALSAFRKIPLLPYELAEQASLIERQELGILGGKQEFAGEEVKTSGLQLPRGVLYELEKSLVLCYTGKSRLSSDIHHKVREAYEKKEPKTRQALKNLKIIAFEMKNALLNGDLKTFGQLLNDNWENQKALHPSVTNSQIDAIFEAIINESAIGGKACGAGGGGCLLFYAQPDCEHLVRRKLEEKKVSIIDFNFDFEGLQIWTA